MKAVVYYDIIPMLQEYWFDDRQKVQHWENLLSEFLMTRDKGIFIKNIYYMLAYAFKVLRQKNYEEIEAEEFETIQDLFAAILAKGISQQLKQGLYREYVNKK